MNHSKSDRCFSTVIAAGTVFVSLSAAAYWNVIDWQAASEGGVSSYSGAFTNVNHWSFGRYTGATELNGGTIDFGGLDVAIGDVLTVGRYEGTAPDFSSWRGINFGNGTRGLKAEFATAGGEIVAAILMPGLRIIIR